MILTRPLEGMLQVSSLHAFFMIPWPNMEVPDTGMPPAPTTPVDIVLCLTTSRAEEQSSAWTYKVGVAMQMLVTMWFPGRTAQEGRVVARKPAQGTHQKPAKDDSTAKNFRGGEFCIILCKKSQRTDD